jgi:hypothetical protein
MVLHVVVAASAGVATALLLIILARRYMLQVLFGPGFTPLVRVTAAALGPSLRALPLDKAQVKSVAKKIAAVLSGSTTVTYEAIGSYTAAEVRDMAEGITDILRAVLTHYKLTLPEADLGRLLDAVADRAIPATPAA